MPLLDDARSFVTRWETRSRDLNHGINEALQDTEDMVRGALTRVRGAIEGPSHGLRTRVDNRTRQVEDLVTHFRDRIPHPLGLVH